MPDTKSYIEIPRQDVDKLLRKKRAVRSKEKSLINFEAILYDNNYNAVNFDDFNINNGQSSSDTHSLDVICKESTLINPITYVGNAVVIDSANGKVRVTLNDQTMRPGLYLMSVALKETDSGNLIYDNELFIYHERSLRSENTSHFPTVDDIRMSLRDSDPLENELIEWYDFSLSDICMAILRTIQQINAIPPPIQPYTTTSNDIEFDMWVDGAQLFLFEMAAEHYRRNRLPYNAGGLTLDDKAKEENYMRAWQIKYQLWFKKVSARKVFYNLRRLYNVVSTRGAVRGWGYTP
ncbi:MAG: hypothetical protein QW727_03825 [Candidatus Pacearchaeota archaeon]